ncbi:Protein WEAK CHLOROPLAST MOVEMENT UNDER BLUE LIGHT 1 [Ananas comosus]|uniref:Protein WEAK CHLOROPLAST MOVEMENT UNDER BLUE LIGHT 1 n=2 Tax=Ananas comosus TaxID=4615 RepID=A0A199UPX9_ANACO|nr:Protein WEAK CHLOROPLAST MOVEMENT UNDER BLUE LIGHT 1 [Ananas comosus]CAD1838070.1 unnamed protein product [Ananas comosus var. bracteatus]
MESDKGAEENRLAETSLNSSLSSPECLPTSDKPPMPIVTNEDTEINYPQGTNLDVEAQIQEDVADSFTKDHNKLNIPENSNESKNYTDDTLSSSSEMLNAPAPRSSDNLMENTESEPLVKLQGGSSDIISDALISNGHTASSEIEKPIEGSNGVVISNEPTSLLELKTKDVIHDVLDQQKKVGDVQNMAPESANDSYNVKHVPSYRGLIDTTAPFESVKAAVTKFGGITDWKAHKALTLERSKHIRLELEKVCEEMPDYKKQSEAAEEAKAQVLNELESTKRQIEELKLNLERAQTEEAQAKQDSELAQLRAKEIEQGIADEASVAAKTQLEVAKARHEAAVSELKSLKGELKELEEKFVSLINERDNAIKKAEEAVSASKEMERTVEDLMLELIASKESLELAHAAHLEAEEHRIGAALAREQDCLNWEKELKQAEDELQQLNEQLLSVKDVKLKLNAATSLLVKLKAELAAYMEAKLNQEAQSTEENGADEANSNQRSVQEALASTRKELEEVKGNIEKAKDEVNILRVAAASLKSELEREKAALTTLQQREGMASIAVSSLEAELNRTKEELEIVQVKEKEAREQMVELPKLLQQAAQEADEAKSVAQKAQEELRKAKEEAEQAKAGANTAEIRLRAALKEIEAAKASEKLAIEAVKALQESEQALSNEEDSPNGITLPLEEYFALSRRAHEAEELAHKRVTAAIAQVEMAKNNELNSLERLKETSEEMDEKREGLKAAMERAERAQEGKLGVEQELRKWRAENEQRRRAGNAAKAAVNPSRSPPRSSEHNNELKGLNKEEVDSLVHPVPHLKLYSSGNNPEKNFMPDSRPRRKKSLLPRIVTFLSRKKAENQK